MFGGESRSVKLTSPQPIKVMVPKNGSEKLIARIVYNGPVRAPIAAGPGDRRGQGLARRQCRDGSAGLCRRSRSAPGSTMRRAIDGASELVIGMFRSSAEKL